MSFPFIFQNTPRFLFLFALLLCGGVTLAQKPVQVNVSLIPPYSTRISDYYLGNVPKLSVMLVNHDLTKPALQVRLKMTIKTASGGVLVQSNDAAIYPTLHIDAGVPVVVAISDLAPYFNANNLNFQGLSRQDYQKGFLNEGIVSFCFEAIEVTSRQSVSSEACAMASLSYFDPPLLNTPARETKLTPREPTNIVFTWTPRHMGSVEGAFNTEYLFQLTEMIDKAANPLSAFERGKPLYEQVTGSTALVYGPAEPLLIPGRRYAWRVQLKQRTNAGDGQMARNHGYSEVYFFDYGDAVQIADKGAPIYKTHRVAVIDEGGGWQRAGLIYDFIPPAVTILPIEYMVEIKSPGYYESILTQPVPKTGPLKTDTWAWVDRSRSVYKGDAPWLPTFRLGAKYADGTIAWDIWRTPLASEPPRSWRDFRINGRFVWAFSKEDETPDNTGGSLLKSVTKSEETWKAAPYTPGATKYPAEGFSASLYETTYNKQLSASEKVIDGKFTFKSPDNYGITLRKFAVIVENNPYYNGWPPVEDKTSSFRSAQGTIAFNFAEKDTTLPTMVLQPKTTTISVGVVCPECTDPTQIAVDLLITEKDLDAMPRMKMAGFGLDAERITYNYSTYRIITTIRDGNAFKKLLNPTNPNVKYAMRVRYKNAEPAFYPLPSLYTDKEDTRMLTQWVSFSPKMERLLSGKVLIREKGRRDARIVLSIPGSSVIPADSRPNIEFSVISDGDGNYTFTNLPEIKKDAPFKLTVTDAGIRPTPYEFELVGDGTNKRAYDIRLKNPTLTLVGRVVDENGQNVYAEMQIDGRRFTTSYSGFYTVQIWDEAPKTIRISRQGFVDQVITYTPRKFMNYGGSTRYTALDWGRAISKLPVFDGLGYRYNDLVTAGLLDCVPNISWQELYDKQLKSSDESAGASNVPTVTIKKLVAKLTINLKTLPATATARIRFSDNTSKEIVFQSGIPFEAPAGWNKYTLDINGDEYLTLSGAVSLVTWAPSTIDVVPVLGTRVTGKARSLPGMTAEKDARISVYGMPYQTVTDADGNYNFLVPRNEELSFETYKDGFEQIDSTVKFSGRTATINFNLARRDASLPAIKTLAGFPVKVSSMVKGSGKDVFEITGTLELKENKVFSIKPGGETKNVLKFKKVRVTVDEKDRTAALPGIEVKFEESVMNVQAWGWAPVEVGGSGGIRLRAGSKDGKEDWTKGNIGAERLTLNLRGQNSVSGLPIQLPDADLTLVNVNVAKLDSTNRFRYAFSAADAGIAALSENAQFSLKFLTADTARVLDNRGLTKDTSKRDARYYEAPLALITSLMIARDTAVLNKDGINLAGYLKFPEIAGMKAGDSGKVRINKFIIGSNFSVKELNFNVSNSKPIIVGVQKVQARLTSIIIKDAGTPNLSFGFGGAIFLKRVDSTKTNPNGTPKLGGAATGRTAGADTSQAQYDEALVIKEFSLTRTPQGNTVTADLKLGPKGVGVKGLTFTTPGESSIKMSYNNAEKSFEFDGSGLITYKKENAGKAGQGTSPGNDSAANSLFPIEIQTFQLRSKDWSMYLAAKANIKINMKVATLNVDKIVVNVGSKVSMQEMNNFLIGDSTKTGNVAQDLNPDEPMDETTASWAIGVKGGFTFGIKSVETKVAGSFLIGNVNDKLSITVNEIELGIKNAAFSLLAKVKMEFSDKRAGFEAQAALTAMGKEFAAGFKFYKLYKVEGQNEGIELGAHLAASVQFVTGPIGWHRIGGGFDLNTSTNIYKVRFEGDLGPAGTPKETMVVQDAYVEIIFETDRCGAYPVIKGGGKLSMKNEIIAEATLTLDFCKPMVLLTIKTPAPVPLPMVPGMLGELDGVFYATVKKVNNDYKPTIFLFAGAKLSSMGDLLKGDLYFAFGYDYDNSVYDAPIECQTAFAKITQDAKTGSILHAVAVGGSLKISKSNTFDIKVGGFQLGYAGYYLDAGGNIKLAVKLKDGTTRAGVGVNVAFGANVKLLDFEARGDVSLALSLEGGYADLNEEIIRDKWARLREEGIDNFSIAPHVISGMTSSRYADTKRKIENQSTRVPNLYTDDYATRWVNAYDTRFSELEGVTVNVSNDAMYTQASRGKEFSFQLKRSTVKMLHLAYYDEDDRSTKVKLNGYTLLSASSVPKEGRTGIKGWLLQVPSNLLQEKNIVRVESGQSNKRSVTIQHNSVHFLDEDNLPLTDPVGASMTDNSQKIDINANTGIFAKPGGDFSYKLDWRESRTEGYELTVRYNTGASADKVGTKVFANGIELKNFKRWRNINASFDEMTYDIPPAAMTMGGDAVTVKFVASPGQYSCKVYATSLVQNGKMVDWYMPHPNEQQAYWEALENLQKKAASPDGNLRAQVLSKRAVNDANWSDYRGRYNVNNPPPTGNVIGRWVLEDNRTYATAYSGGWYSFKLNAAAAKDGAKDLMLSVRYWGSDKNKAQTIYVNDRMLARSTVNAEFVGQSYDVDYSIPNDYLNGNDIRVKFVADPNTASPTVIKTTIKYDNEYYDRKMNEELALMPPGTGPKSWYLKGAADFRASLSVNNYPHCNDYCIFCSNKGFKLCLAASGKFYWRKPDGQSADLTSEFSFGSKTN